MTPATTNLDIYQAITESVFLRLSQIAQALPPCEGGSRSYRVAGGIQHSPDALQRLTNCLGEPVEVCSEPEASLRGAAIFALEQNGSEVAELTSGQVLQPNPEAVDAFQEARRKQIDLEALLSH